LTEEEREALPLDRRTVLALEDIANRLGVIAQINREANADMVSFNTVNRNLYELSRTGDKMLAIFRYTARKLLKGTKL